MNCSLAFYHLIYRIKMLRRRIAAYTLGDIKVQVYKMDDSSLVLIRYRGPQKYENEFEVPLEVYKKNRNLVDQRIINDMKSQFDYQMFG